MPIVAKLMRRPVSVCRSRYVSWNPWLRAMPASQKCWYSFSNETS